jgi:membrane protein implicated in regulation of membrane protease activity
MNPWIWAVGALVVALVELHSPGFYLVWIAAGAAITAAVSLMLDLSLSTQIVTFAVASMCSCVCGYFVYKRTLRPHRGQSVVNQRDLQMVGTRGVVHEPIKNGCGKVRLGDSVWLAEGYDMPEGTHVVVRAMRGTIAVVETVV